MSEPIFETCRHCKCAGPHKVELMQSSIHHAKVTCGSCGRMLRWLPKPDSDPTKYKRPTAHRDLVSDYSKGYCEMCLRRPNELPKGQTLEAQHVIEFQNGGSNERGNIWILCTGCHRFVHWVRTYHGAEMRVDFQELAKS